MTVKGLEGSREVQTRFEINVFAYLPGSPVSGVDVGSKGQRGDSEVTDSEVDARVAWRSLCW
jgi:hypothetical protein